MEAKTMTTVEELEKSLERLRAVIVEQIENNVSDYVNFVDYPDWERYDNYEGCLNVAYYLASTSGVMTDAEVEALHISVLKEKFPENGNGYILDEDHGWTLIGDTQVSELGISVQDTDPRWRKQHGVMEITEIEAGVTSVTVTDEHGEEFDVEVAELELVKE